MKRVAPPPSKSHPITVTPEIIAQCDGPNQFENFDQAFRAMIVVPKAEIEKREANWKRARKKQAKRAR